MQRNVRASKLLWLAGAGALVCVTSVIGCGNGDDDDRDDPVSTNDAGGGVTSTTGSNTGATTADGGALLSDGEIYQIVHQADLGAVAEAELAERLAVHPAVQGLASQVDYAQGTVDARLVGYALMTDLTAVDSPESMSIQTTTAANQAQLGQLGGVAFDSAYLAAQLQEDQSLLTLIDTELLPQAGAPNLQVYIQEVRGLVAGYVTQIQTLEADAGPA
jgi:predicted outer membrane protein